jgi:hypothetical protein
MDRLKSRVAIGLALALLLAPHPSLATDARIITNGEAGSSARATLNNTLTQVFNAQQYGWIPDDTDRSTAALALLSAVSTAGGGTIYFPAATSAYRADSQLFIPNNSASVPSQVNIRLTGAGGGSTFTAAIANASFLDLRYTATDGNAKIETRGTGSLVIDHLGIEDKGSANNTPFIHSTNTTLIVEDNSFIGSASSSSTQDGIVLGGPSETTAGSDVGAPFQGYGTRITSNFFNNVNRIAYLRTFANGVIVNGNSVYNGAGTTELEIAGGGGTDGGNIISGNIFEVDVGVLYGITLSNAQNNVFIGNGFYDLNVSYVSDYRLNGSALYNTIIEGYANPGKYLSYSGSAAQLVNNNYIGENNATIIGSTVTMPNLPSSAGSGGLYVCVDNTGKFYMKSSCP